MVVGLGYNLLKNICSCMQSIPYFTQGSYCQQYYFTATFCMGLPINRETFPPQTFLSIWFYENTAKTDLSLLQSSMVATYLSILKSVGFLKQSHRNLSKEGKQLSPVVQSSAPFQQSIPLFVPTPHSLVYYGILTS